MNNKEKETKKLDFNDYKVGTKIIWNEIVSRYKKGTYVLIFAAVLIAIGDGVVPLISGRFFDSLNLLSGQAGTPLTLNNSVWISLLTLLAFTALSAFGQRWSGVAREKAWYKIFTSYLADGARKLTRLPMSFHNNNPISEVDQKMIRSGNNLSQMFGDVILELLPAFLSIIVATIAIFSINLHLALIIIIGVTIYVLILIRTVGQGAELQRENHKAWIHAWRQQSDGISNISTVKQFSAEEYEDKKNRKNFIDGAYGTQLKLINLWKKISLWQRIIVLFSQFLVLTLSVVFIQKGLLSVGKVIALNAYIGMMFGPFMRLGNMWRTIQNSIISVTDAHKLLTTEEEDYDNKDAISKEINGDIEIKDVVFFHDERKIILDQLTTSVKSGQKIALVGETGSGKTSLIELIYRFYSPNSGSIIIDGVPIEKYNLQNLRSQIGVVPQEPVLFDTSILHNITYPHNNVPMEKVIEAAKKAELFNFIDEQPDKWETIVGDRGVKLSGGQKQRVAIARAIIGNPRILILDESTSALDAKTQHSIEKALDELMEGRTTFIVAHRLSAVRNADVICVLHKGRIIEQGTHKELMQIPDGKYRTLYDLQFQETKLVEEEDKVLQ
ncbi:MAG: Multidrug transporter ATPase and permease [Patescibacteria group bacterium]|nr:Multidrug transporter ATPase and permease [Patescibacteria group bacterium]